MSSSDLSDKQFFEQLARLETEVVAKIKAATADLPDGSPRARERRRQRARTDRVWALQHYFPHWFDEAMGPELTDWQAKRQAALDGSGLLLHEAHRGHGKSTLEAVAMTVLELAEGTSQFTAITGLTEETTVPTVLQVRLEFEANERLRQDFGDMAFGQVWQQGWFTLRNGRECKAISIRQGIRGQRGTIHNQRPDRWKLDDFQDDTTARNPDLVDRLMATIDAKIVPAMAKRRGTLVVAIGHPLTHDCAVMRLRAREAWVKWSHWIATDLETLAPTNPARFDREFIVAIREKVGSLVFNREYMGIAVKPDAMVRPEWWRWVPAEQAEALPLITAVFWDPAISRKRKGGDYKAIVLVGHHLASGDWFTLDAFIRAQASPEEQAIAFWRMVAYAQRQPSWVGIGGHEANGFQVLLDYPIEEVRRQMGIPQMGVRQVVNDQPKDLRVQQLVPSFERGRRHYVQRGNVDKLRNQWLYWPDDGLDGPDAEAGAQQLIVAAAREASTGGGIQTIPGIGATQPETW